MRMCPREGNKDDEQIQNMTDEVWLKIFGLFNLEKWRLHYYLKCPCDEKWTGRCWPLSHWQDIVPMPDISYLLSEFILHIQPSALGQVLLCKWKMPSSTNLHHCIWKQYEIFSFTLPTDIESLQPVLRNYHKAQTEWPCVLSKGEAEMNPLMLQVFYGQKFMKVLKQLVPLELKPS